MTQKVFGFVVAWFQQLKFAREPRPSSKGNKQLSVAICKVITIGNASRVDYYLDGERLEHVNEIVDLGITVSKDLKPSK